MLDDNTDDTRPPTATSTGQYDDIDASRPVTIDLNAVRENLVKDGRHLWVVRLIYHVPDPETALDDMTLGGHNLVGAHKIDCLWCGQRYETPSAPDPVCPGQLVVQGGAS